MSVVNVYHNLVTVAEFPGLKWKPSQNGSREKVCRLLSVKGGCLVIKLEYNQLHTVART